MMINPIQNGGWTSSLVGLDPREPKARQWCVMLYWKEFRLGASAWTAEMLEISSQQKPDFFFVFGGWEGWMKDFCFVVFFSREI